MANTLKQHGLTLKQAYQYLIDRSPAFKALPPQEKVSYLTDKYYGSEAPSPEDRKNMGQLMGGLVNAEKHPIASEVLGGVGNAIQGFGNEAASQVAQIPGIGKYVKPLIPADSGLMYNTGRVGFNLAESALPLGDTLLGESALGRVGGSALKGALLNKAQGGSLLGGALTGGITGAIPLAANPLLRPVMRRALNLPTNEAAQAALDLPGLTIGSTVKNAANASRELTTNKLLPMLEKAGNEGVTVDLTPAREGVSASWLKGRIANNPTEQGQVAELGNQLMMRPKASNPITGIKYPAENIPAAVQPAEARALKRGIASSVKEWANVGGGTVGEHVNAAKRAAYHAIDEQTDLQIPGHKELNAQISNLIHVGSATPQGAGVLGEMAAPYFLYRGMEASGIRPERAALGVLGAEAAINPHINVPLMKTATSPKTWRGLRNAGLSLYNAGFHQPTSGK